MVKCRERLNLLQGHFVHTLLLGKPGTGKTTFVRMLAGLLKSDEQAKLEEEDEALREEGLDVVDERRGGQLPHIPAGRV